LFTERVIALWNSLLVEIGDISSLSRFKNSMKLDFRKFLIVDVDNY